MVMLGTCDFGTAKTTAAGCFDTAGTCLHGAEHDLLHSSSESDTLFKLACNVLCAKLSAEVSLLNFEDVYYNVTVCEGFELAYEDLFVSSLLADEHTRFCNVDVDCELVVLSLKSDLGDSGVIVLVLDEVSDFVVFYEENGIFFL